MEERSEGNFEKLLLFFYHMGVPGMELWLSGLVAGVFTCQAILLALMMLLSIVSWIGEKPLDEESTPLDASWEVFLREFTK